MGEFAVFFFTVLFLAIGFLLLWNGNSLQGHCCSTTNDDSGVCSSKTSKTNCDGDCKWQYWNCDGLFPGQSNYNGPGKPDCEDPDTGSNCSDCPTDCDCETDCPSDCSYSKDNENNLTAAQFCTRASYSENACSSLTTLDNSKTQTYDGNGTVDCTKTLSGSFPGCKWVENDTKSNQCVLNSS